MINFVYKSSRLDVSHVAGSNRHFCTKLVRLRFVSCAARFGENPRSDCKEFRWTKSDMSRSWYLHSGCNGNIPQAWASASMRQKWNFFVLIFSRTTIRLLVLSNMGDHGRSRSSLVFGCRLKTVINILSAKS